MQAGFSLGRNVEGPVGIWTESECRLPLESADGQKTLLRRDAASDAFHEICLEGGEFRFLIWVFEVGHRQEDRVSNILDTKIQKQVEKETREERVPTT